MKTTELGMPNIPTIHNKATPMKLSTFAVCPCLQEARPKKPPRLSLDRGQDILKGVARALQQVTATDNSIGSRVATIKKIRLLCT